MKLFKEPYKSSTRFITRFDELSPLKLTFCGLSLIAGGILLTMLGPIFFYIAMQGWVDMLMGADKARINFYGFNAFGGLPAGLLLIIGGYAAAFLRRPTVPDQMNDGPRKVVMGIYVAMLYSLALPGIPLMLSVVALIYGYDYSWCPSLTTGSGWDSYWVRSLDICPGR